MGNLDFHCGRWNIWKYRVEKGKEEPHGLRLELKVSVQTHDFRKFIRGGQGLLKIFPIFIYMIKNKNLIKVMYLYVRFIYIAHIWFLNIT